MSKIYDLPYLANENMLKIKGIIEKSGVNGISKKEIIRKTQKITTADRDFILTRLLLHGISEKNVRINKSQRTSKMYFFT